MYAGIDGGIGPRVEASVGAGGGTGSPNGSGSSVECSGNFIGGATLGVPLTPNNLDFTAGGGAGFGGGCSIQGSLYGQIL